MILLADLKKTIKELDPADGLHPDILFMGSDWKDKPNPIKQLVAEVYYHDRSIHDYSSTNLRNRIKQRVI